MPLANDAMSLQDTLNVIIRCLSIDIYPSGTSATRPVHMKPCINIVPLQFAP